MRNFLSTSKDKRAEIWEKFVGSGIRGWRKGTRDGGDNRLQCSSKNIHHPVSEDTNKVKMAGLMH